jgi:hypothetical protein
MVADPLRTVSAILNSKDEPQIPESLDSFAWDILIMKVYREERMILERVTSSILWKTDSVALPVTSHDSQGTDHLSNQPTNDLAGLMNSVDQTLDRLLLSDEICQASSQHDRHSRVVIHLVSILRKVPLRDIYASSGWRATTEEIKTSKSNITSWMKENQPCARQCLWHAVSIFSALRTERNFYGHDPFCFLIAALFIWSFDLFARPSESRELGSEAGWLNSKPPTRVDRLRGKHQVQEWITFGDHDNVHITGIGLLTGVDSARRLLVDLREILLSQQPWSPLCHGLAYAISRVLAGLHPTLMDEEDT